MNNEGKWDLEDLQTHIKANLDSSYGAAVVTAALFKMNYGILPKIGLSGFQADGAQSIIDKMMKLPKVETNTNKTSKS